VYGHVVFGSELRDFEAIGALQFPMLLRDAIDEGAFLRVGWCVVAIEVVAKRIVVFGLFVWKNNVSAGERVSAGAVLE
jgi:hypothetical protein